MCLGGLDVILLDEKNGCPEGGICLRGLGIGETMTFSIGTHFQNRFEFDGFFNLTPAKPI